MSHGVTRPRGVAAARAIATSLAGTRDIRQHFAKASASDTPVSDDEAEENSETSAVPLTAAVTTPQLQPALPNAPAAEADARDSEGSHSDSI